MRLCAAVLLLLTAACGGAPEPPLQEPSELSGVGLRLELKEGPSVLETIADSPAARAGLAAGDKVVKVDQAPTAGLTLDQVAEKIRGPEGTLVSITVERKGKPIDFVLKRASIKLGKK